MTDRLLVILAVLAVIGLAACAPIEPTGTPIPEAAEVTAETATTLPEPTPYPTRRQYDPGELVDYTAQTGDTLAALAARFNTTVGELREANPIIPQDATTMPPGMPMQIPIYYLPLWGSPYQILPDWRYVNGPSALAFNSAEYVDAQPGWLKDHVQYVAGQNRRGGEIVEFVALNFSVDPRLLLAILEYQTGALSNPAPPSDVDRYPLGFVNTNNSGIYLQLVAAANRLNNGYYAWRTGEMVQFDLLTGEIERPDPWQNAGTVAVQYYFSTLLPKREYQRAIAPEGLAAVYSAHFGDPWADFEPHLPGSLTQPEFILPFEAKKPWTYTGGPHTGWGTGAPFAAVDFAPPSSTSGCFDSGDWVTAITSGLIVRSETGLAVLDTDGDGDERTGWVIFYLHLATKDRATVGTVLERGGRVGHPSCEGGTSTGTHVHIARKFNGEWIPAGIGALPFIMDGWIARNGPAAYQGTFVRGNNVVISCECSNQSSQLIRDE